MELHQIQIIGFAAGALIVGMQAHLIAKQSRNSSGTERQKVLECGIFCLAALVWQFGNLADEVLLVLKLNPASWAFQATFLIRRIGLYLLPLSLSYLSPLFAGQSGAGWLPRLGRWMRMALWPWTVTLITFHLASFLGWVADPRLSTFFARTSVRLILVFFGLFMIQSIQQVKNNAALGHKQLRAAHLVGLVACLGGAAVLVAADWMNNAAYVRIGVMLTLTTFAIAVAYRQYQFPFMDTFILHATAGVLLLGLLVSAQVAGMRWLNPELIPLALVAFTMLVLYSKEPLMRWVERALMGFDESIESQENRIGETIRGFSRPEELQRWVSDVATGEMKAHWARLDSTRHNGADLSFEVPGSQPMWLSVGPRLDGRPYMSRQHRLGQTTALQLAAQCERMIHEDMERRQLVGQHELRELTSRAQIQALQAQIRPHFLFNTLNVLSNLIHTDARRAEDLTEELAAVFRYTLDSTRMEWVLLEDEIRFINSYLRIEKARFEERLSYWIDLQPETRRLRIPPMILQPLVENAVKHGVSPRTEGGEVHLTAKSDAGRLVLVVEDAGKGMKSEENFQGHGIGLRNVRDRLRHIYRDRADLCFLEVEPSRTRVTLTLPEFVEAGV